MISLCAAHWNVVATGLAGDSFSCTCATFLIVRRNIVAMIRLASSARRRVVVKSDWLLRFIHHSCWSSERRTHGRSGCWCEIDVSHSRNRYTSTIWCVESKDTLLERFSLDCMIWVLPRVVEKARRVTKLWLFGYHLRLTAVRVRRTSSRLRVKGILGSWRGYHPWLTRWRGSACSDDDGWLRWSYFQKTCLELLQVPLLIGRETQHSRAQRHRLLNEGKERTNEGRRKEKGRNKIVVAVEQQDPTQVRTRNKVAALTYLINLPRKRAIY